MIVVRAPAHPSQGVQVEMQVRTRSSNDQRQISRREAVVRLFLTPGVVESATMTLVCCAG